MNVLRDHPPSQVSRLPLLAIRVAEWLFRKDEVGMRTILSVLAAGAVAIMLLPVMVQGGNGDPQLVTLCHYDRNEQGPNAGPHTIRVDGNAVDHHLDNHTRTNGYMGDDHLGECSGSATITPSSTIGIPVAATPNSTPPTTPTGYVPGVTPCEEDEVFDAVTATCIHIDRIAGMGDDSAVPDALPESGIMLESQAIGTAVGLSIVLLLVGLSIVLLLGLVWWVSKED